MNAKTQQVMNTYLTTVLPFCNQQKVKALLVKLGYVVQDSPTVDLCLRAIDEYDTNFTIPFGKIAQAAIESPKFEAYLKVAMADSSFTATKLNKATSTLTNDQKISLVNSIFGTVTNWFTTGASIANNKINQSANEQNAAANLLWAQTQSSNTEAQNSQKILLIGIAGVVLLVVIVAIIIVVVNGRR